MKKRFTEAQIIGFLREGGSGVVGPRGADGGACQGNDGGAAELLAALLEARMARGRGGGGGTGGTIAANAGQGRRRVVAGSTIAVGPACLCV